jgi:hypothetical protein
LNARDEHARRQPGGACSVVERLRADRFVGYDKTSKQSPWTMELALAFRVSDETSCPPPQAWESRDFVSREGTALR